MLSDMSENHAKRPSEPTIAPSPSEGSEKGVLPDQAISLRSFEVGTGGLDAVDQDIQSPLQCVPMLGESPNVVDQFRTGNGRQFLRTNDPRRSSHFHNRRQTRKGCVAPRLTQRGHDVGRIYADKIGLQVNNKLPAPKAIEIKLCHVWGYLEASKLSERQSVFGNLFSIGIDRVFVFNPP